MLRSRGPLSPDEALEKAHACLHSYVSEAAASVASLETTWSQSELTRRLVRYIYNAAKAPDLLSLHWKDAAKKLVESAMTGYCAACQEKEWFYQIDLVPALTSAAWELLSAKWGRKVRHHELEEIVGSEYEEIMDKTMLQKAMWDISNGSFEDPVVRSKVYNAISRSYQTAFDECIIDTRPRGDREKIEQFMKRWISDSMHRAWCALEGPDRALSHARVLRLFQASIAPFGEHHPFSCIPVVFTEVVGRPDCNWRFIRLTVEQLFASWRTEPSSSSKKRKPKRSTGAEDEDAVMEEVPSPSATKASRQSYEAAARRPEPVQPEAAPAGRRRRPPAPEPEPVKEEVLEGHPDCTSVEDCIGSRDDCLVRHMLPGEELGDVYCRSCWASFLDQNASLQGVWEDGEEAGAPFSCRRG